MYLRRFAFDQRKNVYRIHAFDKALGRGFLTSVRNVAAQLNFYEKKDTGIERGLQQAEDVFAPVYRRLLEIDTIKALTLEQRAIVAAFVALQQVRTPEHRMISESLVSVMRNAMVDRGMPGDVPQLQQLTPEQLREFHVRSIEDFMPRLAQIIVRMKWILVLNETSIPYWTSDHPVTMVNPLPRAGIVGNVGWKCSGIQAYFPLSPTRTLTMCDRQMYSNLPDVLRTTDPQTVVFNNHLQIQSSTRFLYASHGAFRFATKVLSEQPIFADPNRPRTSVS